MENVGWIPRKRFNSKSHTAAHHDNTKVLTFWDDNFPEEDVMRKAKLGHPLVLE